TDFHQDPVVGWLVVIGGSGLGAFRPIYEGNNTVGRSSGQRIPVDFGDETISSEEQAYIRYDSVDRRFLLVPNLAKTNIVAVNNTKPTAAVELAAMDVITMGHTQIVFVPFCGQDFDWGELTEMKG
ncbi:MAG: FHA domain-containing protein, partial [Hyphomicrobiaceae bacterium]